MKQPTACLFVKSVKILRVGNRIVHISQATTASWNDIKNLPKSLPFSQSSMYGGNGHCRNQH